MVTDSMQLKWEPSKKDSDKARICVDEIHEVRSGKNSEVFLSVDTAEHFPEECAFSIIYGVDYQTLDLVAATTEEANIWCTGLRLIKLYSWIEKISLSQVFNIGHS